MNNNSTVKRSKLCDQCLLEDTNEFPCLLDKDHEGSHYWINGSEVREWIGEENAD